jgi:hypothetical protein
MSSNQRSVNHPTQKSYFSTRGVRTFASSNPVSPKFTPTVSEHLRSKKTGMAEALASLDGPWMAFGLLPQIDWAKCAAGKILGVIRFD